MRRAAWLVGAFALVAVLVIGLTQASDDAGVKEPAEAFDLAAAKRSLAGSPQPLAALHDQSAELLDGGREVFAARLKALRGYPVVINKWGSWCVPCRAEFPVFQKVATERGKEIAFLGINGMDNGDQAREFLDEFPLPYPSYVDPDGDELADVVRAVGPYPMTIFITPDGEIEIAIARQYRTAAELEADIKQYLKV